MASFGFCRNDLLKRSRLQGYFGEISLKTGKTLFGAATLAILAVTLVLPLAMVSASPEEEQVQATWRTENGWTYIQNDVITIVFPAGGKKPMFLWWYTDSPDNVYVVKYKGLVEYVTYEQQYFMWKHQAEAWRIKERIQAHFFEPRRHTIGDMMRLRAIMRTLYDIGNYTDLHAPYLPFSGCRWELSDPVNVTRGDVRYLSFNFTLADVPGHRPNLQFAENNIIIRCRFYYTPATEDVYGQYTYTVSAGELKMDLVVKHWEWNIDKLRPLVQELREEGFDIPEAKTGLALWINLASINMTQLPVAGQDAVEAEDTALTEEASTTMNMYVEGQSVSTAQNKTGVEDEQPLQNRWRERSKFRFETENATLAGFFKFVPKAIITDGVTYNATDVTASYISAGSHMRVFMGYPYFGNSTLEHDPSLGLESLPTLVTPDLLLVVIGAASVITAAVMVVRWKRKTVNIVGAK